MSDKFTPSEEDFNAWRNSPVGEWLFDTVINAIQDDLADRWEKSINANPNKIVEVQHEVRTLSAVWQNVKDLTHEGVVDFMEARNDV